MKDTCGHWICILQAKAKLLENIEQFVRLKILLSGQAISDSANEKIQDGDVILVYSW